VVFTNTGHIRAKDVLGKITLTRKANSGRLLQSTVRPFTRQIISPNGGFIQQFIGIPNVTDLNALRGEDITVNATISYDNGVKDRPTQQFCSGMFVIPMGTTRWEDCENIEARKKYFPDY
jgi:hypothetical protein